MIGCYEEVEDELTMMFAGLLAALGLLLIALILAGVFIASGNMPALLGALLAGNMAAKVLE